MKKLLLLLLFGFSAVGADKPKIKADAVAWSGLEGWGKKEISVIVQDYSDRDKNFDVKAIENQVKLRLGQGGFKFKKFASDSFIVNTQPVVVDTRVVGYSIAVLALRPVFFQANGKTYLKRSAQVFVDIEICGPSTLRESINTSMDKFFSVYDYGNKKDKE